ncbi:hypothetical protein ACS0TY_012957 [Phlomoides rotata]
METVERLTAEKPVVIFSKSGCCMCHTVKTLMSSFGADATIYDLDELPEGQQLEKVLVGDRRPSFPVVFIGRELVGGENKIMSLHVKGKLVPLLKKAKAIWI